MTDSPAVQIPAPLSVRVLAVALSCLLSGVGLLSLTIGYLEDAPVHVFGICMFFFGLLPVALAMRSRKSAAWVASASVLLGLSALVVKALLG